MQVHNHRPPRRVVTNTLRHSASGFRPGPYQFDWYRGQAACARVKAVMKVAATGKDVSALFAGVAR